MIKTKIITDDYLLELFQKNYVELAKNQVGLDYFKQAQVRVFYRESEENMLAGFCINSQAVYRTFLPLSAEQLQVLNQNHHFDEQPPHEISCLWVEPASRHASWMVYFFLMMMVDMLRLRPAPLIFGTHGKNVNNYFAYPLPDVIFYDQLFVATKGEVCDFWIRKGSKWQILKGFVVLATIRLLGGYRALAKFRLQQEKDNSKS